jgi:hypothetical protein
LIGLDQQREPERLTLGKLQFGICRWRQTRIDGIATVGNCDRLKRDGAPIKQNLECQVAVIAVARLEESYVNHERRLTVDAEVRVRVLESHVWTPDRRDHVPEGESSKVDSAHFGPRILNGRDEFVRGGLRWRRSIWRAARTCDGTVAAS